MITPTAEAIDLMRRSFRLALSPGLRRWVLIPVLVNALLFGSAYYFVGSWVSGFMGAWLGSLQFEGFWAFLDPVVATLSFLLQILVWVLLLVLMATVFTAVAQLLAAPFMGFLAARIDLQAAPPLGFPPQPEESISSMVFRTVRRELRKTWYWLWRAVLLLILVLALSFIPGLNLLGSALWFGWSAWMLGIQYIDYGADTRLTPWNEVLGRLRAQRWRVLALGSLLLAATMIPLLNLVILPVGVIAGTLYWLEYGAARPRPAAR